jgi:hypothetical protein
VAWRGNFGRVLAFSLLRGRPGRYSRLYRKYQFKERRVFTGQVPYRVTGVEKGGFGEKERAGVFRGDFCVFFLIQVFVSAFPLAPPALPCLEPRRVVSAKWLSARRCRESDWVVVLCRLLFGLCIRAVSPMLEARFPIGLAVWICTV